MLLCFDRTALLLLLNAESVYGDQASKQLTHVLINKNLLLFWCIVIKKSIFSVFTESHFKYDMCAIMSGTSDIFLNKCRICLSDCQHQRNSFFDSFCDGYSLAEILRNISSVQEVKSGHYIFETLILVVSIVGC